MITIIALLVLISISFIYYYTAFQYWKKKGVKHDKPVIPFGNNSKGYLMQRSKAQSAEEMYRKYPNEKVVGFYRLAKPELILRDPQLIKKVMITDFNSFYYRGFHPNRKHLEPLAKNLFFAEGDFWKMLRTRMTPAFTSAKLKAMFPLVIERAEKLQQRTLRAAASSTVLNAVELMARYTTDFIGACAFGLDSDSLNDENSDFRKLGREIFEVDLKLAVIALLKETFPDLCRNFKYFGKIENYAKQLVSELQKSRNYQPSGRNDYLDMMLEIKNKGDIEIESLEKMRVDGTGEKVMLNFDDDVFVGQIIVFFAAGFETSSNSTSMTLHYLAFHPEIQKRVQEDIDKALAKHDNKISYDSIKEMTYLEMAYKETLRMYPPLASVSRVCSRKYTFEDIGLTIDKDVKIFIPIQALHMDPKYWDNPQEFQPDRFHPDNIHKINKDVYLPFGLGPRNCIGTRLGLMQSLAGLVAILSKLSVSPAPQTVRHPKINPLSEVVQSVVGGLPLMFSVRK